MGLGLQADELVYGFAVGRVRVREGVLVDPVRVGRLAESDSLEAMRMVLAETIYGPLLSDAKTVEDVEAAFSQRLEDAYDVGETVGMPVELSGYFRARHDYENLRAAVKSGFGRELEVSFSRLGRVSAQRFSTYARTRTFADLPPALEEAARSAVRAYETSGEPASIDRELDRRYFDETLVLAGALRSSWVEWAARVRVDIVNGSVTVRTGALGQKKIDLETVLLDGGYIDPAVWVEWARQESTAGGLAGPLEELIYDRPSPTEYRRRASEYWARLLDGAKVFVSGPVPVFTYISRIEREVRSLRTVIVGRLAGLTDSPAILAEAALA